MILLITEYSFKKLKYSVNKIMICCDVINHDRLQSDGCKPRCYRLPQATGVHKAAQTVTGPHCMLVRRRSCCIYLTFKIIHRSIKDDGLESWSTPNRWTLPQGCNNGLDRGSTANFSYVLLQMLHSHWDGFGDWRGGGNGQQPTALAWSGCFARRTTKLVLKLGGGWWGKGRISTVPWTARVLWSFSSPPVECAGSCCPSEVSGWRIRPLHWVWLHA